MNLFSPYVHDMENINDIKKMFVNSLVNKSDRDTKRIGHVFEGETAVGLEQLIVGHNTHLAHIVAVVRVQVAVKLHQLFNLR